MNRFLREALRIVAPLLVIAAGIAAFAAIGRREPPGSRDNGGKKATVVKTVPVQEFTDSIEIDVDGLVVPYREITLAAEVAGRITFKAEECRTGQFVKANTRLFEIDPEMYKLEIERLEAEKQQADGNLQELHVEIANSTKLIDLAVRNVELEGRKLERARQLHERGVATDGDLDLAEQNELTAKNNKVTLENQKALNEKRVARLEQGIKVIDAKLKQARRDFQHTTIVAPVDGVIVSDPVEQDGLVQNGAQLVVIEDTSAVEVRCNLKMDELGWLWNNSDQPEAASAGSEPTGSPVYDLPEVPVIVSYNLAGHRYEWQGHVARLDGAGLDERTRTIPCRIVVPNPREFRVDGQTASRQSRGPRTLMRGMFVHVKASVWSGTPLLQIPEQALRPGNSVWYVDDGKMQHVTVQVLRHDGDSVLVSAAATKGLDAGDPLIVSPLSHPQDGTAVEIEQAEQAP